MPFTLEYALVNDDDNVPVPHRYLDFGAATGNLDVIGLANGGFAGIGDLAGSLTGTIFNSKADSKATFAATGTNASMAQLSDGNLVIASQDSDSIRFKVVNSVTGADVVSTVDLNVFGNATTNADATALAGGGFAIAYQANYTATDNDIVLSIRDNDGSGGTDLTVDVTLANDKDACIAQLDGGNIAVAWTRTVGAQTEVWYSIRSASGSEVVAASLLDTTGTINRDVSISAIDGGGFALAYEDNEYGGGVAIALATLDANGGNPQKSNTGGVADADPHLIRLSNGMLAMSATVNGDSFVSLVDTATGQVVPGATRDIITTSILNDSRNPIVAGFGAGYLVTGDNDVTDGDARGEVVAIQRTATGDQFSPNEFNDTDGFFDIVTGGFLNDVLNGGAGNDTIGADSGFDDITGGDGDDLLQGGVGNDDIDGGTGNDRIFAHTQETPDGSAAGDTLIGGQGNDFIRGANGSETLTGDAGNDTLDGGSNGDTMTGGIGNDVYVVDSIEDVVSEAGGNGTDTVQSSLTFTLSGGFEHLTLIGANAINGTGNGGNNRLIGNALDNVLNGGAGGDSMAGRGGNDTYVVNSALDRVSESGGSGTDTVKSSVDYTLGAGLDNLGLSGGQAIDGHGNALANQLTGNAAANTLFGLAGNDAINGAQGNDTVTGGHGADTLTSASGADIYDYNAVNDTGTSPETRDRITDFAVDMDRINLATIDFVPGGADNAFTFKGIAAFTAAGQVRLARSGADTIVEINTVGASGAEMTILLAHVTATDLDALDFIL